MLVSGYPSNCLHGMPACAHGAPLVVACARVHAASCTLPTLRLDVWPRPKAAWCSLQSVCTCSRSRIVGWLASTDESISDQFEPNHTELHPWPEGFAKHVKEQEKKKQAQLAAAVELMPVMLSQSRRKKRSGLKATTQAKGWYEIHCM